MVLKTIIFFLISGLLEIGGGYLVWKYFKNNAPLWVCIAGFAVMCAYAISPIFHTINFGRAFAAYSGFFVLMSVLWGHYIDKTPVDMWDIIGTVVCLVGACIIVFAPRTV